MTVKSAARVLDLVEWLAERTSPVGLAEACHGLALPKSSILLLFRTLVESGYVLREADGRYRLIRLPGEASSDNKAWGTLLRLASPILAAAVDEAGESGFIAVLSANHRLHYLNKILPASREVRYDRDISFDRTPHYVASGIAILAAQPEAVLAAYLDTLKGDPDEIASARSAIAKARRDGIAVNLKGRIDSTTGVAAAVLDASGVGIAAINLAGPIERMKSSLPAVIRTTCDAAERISQQIIRRSRAGKTTEAPQGSSTSVTP
ncbi:MAG: helix-turn-helix domain-containing protein [Acetobacteraceae bacterium]